MKGLILKDFYIMKSMGRSYLLFFGIFAFMTLMGLYDGISFVSFLMIMMLIMLPINTFAYDEQAKWDNYAAAAPAGRKGVVGAKYLFTVVLLSVALVLCVALQLGLYAFDLHGTDTLSEMLAVAVGTVSAGCLLNAILIPLLFKFGTQKSRIFLMAVIGLVTASVVIFMGVATDTGLDLSWLVGAGLWLLPLLAVGLMVISYFISLGIYSGREL